MKRRNGRRIVAFDTGSVPSLSPMAGSPLSSAIAPHKAKSSSVATKILSCWKKADGNPARLRTAGSEQILLLELSCQQTGNSKLIAHLQTFSFSMTPCQ